MSAISLHELGDAQALIFEANIAIKICAPWMVMQIQDD
jgi:hypothetical protein